jgi:GntR family transcriptional regulator/MocR family aminotransferase
MSRGKTTLPLDLPFPPTLSQAGSGSKRDCIVSAIRNAISTGLLSAQSDLPSSRTLAERWQVSRGTVEAAFDRLYSEGYITRAQGSGTRVSAVVPESFLPPPKAETRKPDDRLASGAPDTRMSRAPEEAPVRAGIPFIARLAAPELLKVSHWQKHAAKAAKDGLAMDASSMPTRGSDQLRQQIAAYLGAFRGLSCHPEDIFITLGIRQAIDAVARVLLAPGSKVAIEDPGYPGARRIFELAAAEVVDVAVDAYGINVADLEQLRDVSLVYITPAHQSPLGVTMSIARREQLLTWSGKNRAWIIEDDYDGEFNFQSAPLPALKSQDRQQRVIYCSSFNKTVAAELRVGFMVVPPAIQGRMLALWETIGSPVSATTQLALAAFMASGDFSNHLRRSRQAYQQRRDVVLRELARHAAGKYEVSGCHAGFHFVLWLKHGADEREIVSQAAAVGITLQSLGSLCRRASFGPAFIVGYSALSLSQAKFSGRKLGLILAAANSD